MRIKKQFISTICLFILLGLLINGFLIRKEREFRESFWIQGVVLSADCGRNRKGIHAIKVDSFTPSVLVAFTTIDCEDLLDLLETEVKVKVSYGYETVPYSYEIKTSTKNFKSKNELNSINQYSRFSNTESIFILFLSVTMFMSLIYKSKK